ncbi:hypothetical protein [Tropicibacter sp. Alg240-R139]|uniref:hypothetical protein n=1 Tax=Tropicibacter sp. Alg240-R139 TaxID=2305991 RepID=UPI0013DE80BA|nr:hypothetical protein [Tropicibacter sp. Alg240-R139]
MTLKTLAATAALIAMPAVSALASDDFLPSVDDVFTEWGKVEGWTVWVDVTRNSCLAERIDSNTNIVQMGLNKAQDFAYLGVFTKADIKLRGGKEKVTISLDGKLYEGNARKKSKHMEDGYKGGYILIDNPEFVTQVQKRYTMVVFPKREEAFSVSLDGTFKAIEAARKCQAELNG